MPWFSLNDPVLLKDIELGLDLTMAACSLLDAHFSRALRHWVRRTLGLGLAVHPQLELLQLPEEFVETRDDRSRYKLGAYRELLVDAVGSFDPRGVRLGSRQAHEAAANLLQLGVSAAGTGLIVGSFLINETSPTLVANNLALLDGAIREFAEQNLAELTPDAALFAMPRQLFASASISVRLLREKRFVNRIVDELVAREAGVYGYWVQASGLDSRVPRAVIGEMRDLLYRLQEESGRPVISDRMGGFGLGFLAGGLAGYCVGTAAPEFVSFPPTSFRRAQDPDEKKKEGFAFVGYNETLLRNFALRGKNAGKGAFAAHRFPCGGCGHHDSGKPPASNTEKKLHGFYWHRLQARMLSEEGAGITAARFRRMIDRAEDGSVSIGDATPFYDALRETLPVDVSAVTLRGR